MSFLDGTLVLFEPDEDQSYWAIVDQAQLNNSKIDVALLEAIAKVIESIRK